MTFYTVECSGDKNYEFVQTTPSTVWVVNHTLNKYPAVTVLDPSDNVVIADVTYINESTIQIDFSSAQTGKVILN